MSSEKIRILYVSGAGRSGSTLLELMLGQINGFTAAGELRHFWERGVLKNQLCSCGRHFDDCSFWQEVAAAIESDGHTLKRTAPILNGKVDEEGIVYIGEGGLGAPLREPYPSRWYLRGGFTARLHHVWMIDIWEKEMRLRAIDINGNVVDEYVIQK